MSPTPRGSPNGRRTPREDAERETVRPAWVRGSPLLAGSVALERTTSSEITEVNPPSTWAYHGVDGPIRAITRVTVAPLGDSAGSRVTINVDFQGHGIGKLLVPLVRWLGRKDSPTNCRNLKERLEGGD